MHASSFAHVRHSWRGLVGYALRPHMTDAEHYESHRLSDNPLRARLRGVRLLPLIVPGLAVMLACCVMLIAFVLR